jgi:hypothetical protein
MLDEYRVHGSDESQLPRLMELSAYQGYIADLVQRYRWADILVYEKNHREVAATLGNKLTEVNMHVWAKYLGSATQHQATCTLQQYRSYY